jgi:4-diphosphocytidyl-2-C-methyl-D-erythritol kinase
MAIRILCPAKINLFLHVTGKRPDGYHTLVSLMCRVGLFDRIFLTPAPGDIRVQCAHPGVPEDASNLAFRAARVFYEASGRKEGIDIRIEKTIPVAAGLGGGSSDAAGVLLGLNHLCGTPFTQAELMRLAGPLGADVPFFIFQAPALASGIGDRLEHYPHLKPFPVLLCCPPFAVSTRMVYEKLNLQLTKCGKQNRRIPLKNEPFDPHVHLCNDLETVTLALHPELAAFKHVLIRHGAMGTLMSGSGPALFSVFATAEARQHAVTGMVLQRGWRMVAADLLLAPLEMIAAA